MKTRPFGSSRAWVPVIGQGTWELEKQDRRVAADSIRRAVDAGATHIDTAEMYGAGKAEEVLRGALDGIRDRVFLASKVLPANATEDGVVAACERSLARLGTDRLDLYLLHWPSPHPMEGTVRGMQRLVKDGKIRAAGVSNFDENQLHAWVGAGGADVLACNQVLYHLHERAVEHAVLPWCEARGIAVVAYSPFGGGAGAFPSTEPGRRALEEVAAAHGVTPRQAALAWTVRRPSLFTIPRTYAAAHALENAAAGDLVLTEKEISRLEVAFPRGAKPKELPTA